MNGYDLDGVVTAGASLEAPCVVISGRTWAEWDDACRAVAQRAPLYIRGTGAYGDRVAAAEFKSAMIRMLSVTQFVDDDPVQVEIIRAACPQCVVSLWTQPEP